jgi:hypothetical protein
MNLLIFAGLVVLFCLLAGNEVVKTVEYVETFTTDTSRGPSTAIWGSCPKNHFQEDPYKGMYFFDDFLMAGNIPSTAGGTYRGSSGQWNVWADQPGTITDGAAEGGVIVLGSGTTTQEGVTLASTAGSFRIVTTSTLALNQKLWFECRVAVSSITTGKRDFFIGLADGQGTPATGSITTTAPNTLATAPNLIGFYFRNSTNPTDVGFVYQLAAGTAVYGTGLQTLLTTILGAAAVAGTFYKLGFVFDPNAPSRYVSSAGDLQTVNTVYRPLITIYANGIPCTTFLTSQNVTSVASGHAFPTGFMGPAISFMNGSAAANTVSIDWIGCAQSANS